METPFFPASMVARPHGVARPASVASMVRSVEGIQSAIPLCIHVFPLLSPPPPLGWGCWCWPGWGCCSEAHDGWYPNNVLTIDSAHVVPAMAVYLLAPTVVLKGGTSLVDAGGLQTAMTSSGERTSAEAEGSRLPHPSASSSRFSVRRV